MHLIKYISRILDIVVLPYRLRKVLCRPKSGQMYKKENANNRAIIQADKYHSYRVILCIFLQILVPLALHIRMNVMIEWQVLDV